MSRTRKHWIAYIIIALLWNVLSFAVHRTAVAEAAAAKGMLDDFETYASTDELVSAYTLWSENGTDIPRTITKDRIHDGKQALLIESKGSASGWASISHLLGESQRDWSSFEGLSLWIDNPSGELQFNLEVVDNLANPAFNLKKDGYVYLNSGDKRVKTALAGEMISIPAKFRGTVHIPFSQLNQASWQQCGTCDRPLNLAAVNTYKLGYNPKTYPEASFAVDTVSLYANVIDDFEAYESDAQLHEKYTLWVDTGKKEISWSIMELGSSKALRIAANGSDAPWASLTHMIADERSDFSGSDGLAFRLRNQSASSLSFNIEVEDTRASGVFKPKQGGHFYVPAHDGYWMKVDFAGDLLQVPANFEGTVRIPFGQLEQASWQSEATGRSLDQSKVKAVKFGYSPASQPGHVIVIDEISLWEGEPALAQPNEEPAGEPAKPFEPLPAPVWAIPGGTYQLKYETGPIDNPLKGFLPFSNADKEGYFKENDEDWRETVNQLPHSMEFFYMPLKDIMKDDNEFDWSILEQEISEIAERGNQAIFRIYLDYPHKPPGIPNFLLEGGLKTKEYDYHGNGGQEGRSVSPDYNDPKLIKALEQFIAALGKKYDGDPRVGFIQTGLIGFWGEWHTWPQDGWTPESGWTATPVAEAAEGKLTDWMPTIENQTKIVNAFDQAFNKTRILVRYPTAFNKELNMGYHDDSFAFQTLPPEFGGQDWHFVGRLINNGVTDKWKKEPVGGEMRPEIQIKMWNNDPPRYNDTPIDGAQGEDFYKALELTHASWLKVQGIFQTPLEPDALKKAKEASGRLGYDYYVPKAYLAAKDDKTYHIAVEVENKGVAPFYYDWQVELAARNGSGKVVKSWKTNWKLSGILPNSRSENHNRLFEMTADTHGLGKGRYTLSLRVVNPLANGKKFRFSNESQNADGWLDLGNLSIMKDPDPSVVKYTVEPGDTLSRIAARYHTTWQKLHSYNKLKNPNLIFPDQIILIPPH